MGLKSTIIKALALFLITGSVLASLPFNSLEEFNAWEKDLKMNAKFHPDYKVPDYIRVALMNSGPENAYFRYLFFTDNPQYAEDFANIHKGKLSEFATDNSTVRKSKLDSMPADIAEYYRQNPNELLAAEGFGFDPVLARKVYTGEIQLPYGVNKTEWLRDHAWTPDGIVERNNVVAYANTPFSGDYNLRKIDPATGKPVEPSASEQVKGQIALYNKYQKDMEVLAGKIKVLRESIGVSLQTGSSNDASIDCSGDTKERFKARCSELAVLIKSYNDLEKNCEKLRTVISSLDKNLKLPNAFSAEIASTQVKRGTGDVFAAEKEGTDCPAASQKDWRCLKTKVTTFEGKSYNVLLKWSRPNQKSKGTVFYGSGGHGGGDMLEDQNQRLVFNEIAEKNEIRTVILEMLDKDPKFELGAGYWIHGGGYQTLAQIFMAVWETAVNKKLIHGDFTNYYGGSNGTMFLASAMARYNADVYFDRVLFMIGPFLPDLATACNKNSASSFYLNNPEKFKWVMTLLSQWNYQDQTKNVCDNLSNDRTSILKNNKKEYPNTIIHVVVGALEDTVGFGPWFNASNFEWYNSIKAKHKDRLIRPNLGHDNSYEDMLRILKLAPNEVPDRSFDQCKTGTKDVDGKKVEYSCGCNGMPGGVFKGDGCYYKDL